MWIRDLFFTKFFLNALYNHRFTKIYFSLFGSPVVKKPFSRTEQVMILYVFAIPAAFIIIRNLHFPNNFRSLPKRTLKTINNDIYIPFQNIILLKSIFVDGYSVFGKQPFRFFLVYASKTPLFQFERSFIFISIENSSPFPFFFRFPAKQSGGSRHYCAKRIRQTLELD